MSESTIFRPLKLFRIHDWVHVLGLPFLGLVYAQLDMHDFSFISAPTLLCFIASSLYMAHGYAFNESMDTIVRVEDSEHALKVRENISFKTALLLSYVPLLINLILAVFFLKAILPFIAAGWLFSYLYSGRRFRFKSIVFLDLVVNAAGFSILFLIGYCSLKMQSKDSLMIAALFFFLFMPLQMVHEMTHLEQDKIDKTYTTAVRYGIAGSSVLFLISLFIFMLWSLLLWHLQILSSYVFLISLAFSIYMFLISKKVFQSQDYMRIQDLRIHARVSAILYGVGMFFVLTY
jgi:4-hydroxybenzoate polyprenyltransferase